MKDTCRFLGLGQIEFSFTSSYAKSILLLLVLTMFVSSAMAQDLDPNLPPGGNFDLSYWKLTRPNQQERDADQLSAGYTVDGEFYTDATTGAMVFWCPNDGATGGSTYPRNELREMIRRFDTSIPTQGINKNNWVFSSSTMANQEAAGGIDGIMTATVAVDHVSETSDASFKVGRTIVGQIHASDDEPCRLYYRKLPGNTRGSIYFAHEPTTGPEQWYEMIGSRNDGVPDPVDGVALGEVFSYEIRAIGNLLTVTIMREGKPDVVQEVDMTDSGFADDWMYFKAGNYNQNNAGDSDEYAQVSFFALDVTHFAPTPPTAYLAPSDIPRFQPFLAECKLQAPTSSTAADNNSLNSGYTHPTYFYVVDGGFTDSQTLDVLTPSTEFNWALNQPVVGTGTPDGNNDEDNLVDDDTDTRWSVQDFPKSATVDLEGNIKITQTEVTCYQDRAYQFIIEGALNEDGPYTTIIDRSNNNIPSTPTAPIVNSVDSIEARYVRITVSGADVYTGPWVSLTELRVFGDGERTFTNVTELEEEEIRISPNPASSIVTIEAGYEYDTVVVYDATGRRVLQRPISKSITLEISGLQSGVYFIKLEGQDKSEVRKLIKR